MSVAGESSHGTGADNKSAAETSADVAPPGDQEVAGSTNNEAAASLPAELRFEDHVDWQTSTTFQLRKHFSDDTIIALRHLFDEGRNPPPRQDSGWGSRERQRSEQVNEEEQAMNVGAASRPSQGRGRGAGRGGRAASDGNPFKARDSREVVTQVSSLSGHPKLTVHSQSQTNRHEGLHTRQFASS